MKEWLRKDLENMEEAMARTVDRTDIWQDRIVYALAVAVYHILDWIRRDEERVMEDRKKDIENDGNYTFPAWMAAAIMTLLPLSLLAIVILSVMVIGG